MSRWLLCGLVLLVVGCHQKPKAVDQTDATSPVVSIMEPPYRWVVDVAITNSAFVGVMAIEGSLDGTRWGRMPVSQMDGCVASMDVFSLPGHYRAEVVGWRFIRVNTLASTTGTPGYTIAQRFTNGPICEQWPDLAEPQP